MTLPRSEARPPTLLAALLHSPHLRLPACSSHFSPSRFLPLPIIPCLFPQLSFSAPAHPPPRSLSAPGLPRHDRLPHPPSSSPRALPVPPCALHNLKRSLQARRLNLSSSFYSRTSRHPACHRRTCRVYTPAIAVPAAAQPALAVPSAQPAVAVFLTAAQPAVAVPYYPAAAQPAVAVSSAA